MMKKRSKKRIQYNVIFVIVILLGVFNIVDHFVRMDQERQQFLFLYKEKQQLNTDQIADALKKEIERQAFFEHDWDSIVPEIRNIVMKDESVWLYIACNGKVEYYKNQDLNKANATIGYDMFMQNRMNNSLIITQRKFQATSEEYNIGLVKSQNLVLEDTGYSNMLVMLLLGNVITILIFMLISSYFLWKTIRVSNENEKKQAEIIKLNNKLELRNQEINQKISDMEMETYQAEKDDIKYDRDILRVLLEKANFEQYYPIGIQVIRYDMGNLYFTKTQMKLIQMQLREQAGDTCEVFEVKKGEFVFLILKKKEDSMCDAFEKIRMKAVTIAKQNHIEVHSGRKIITGVVPDLNYVVEELICKLTII